MPYLVFLIMISIILSCDQEDKNKDAILIDLFDTTTIDEFDIKIVDQIPLESSDEALYSEIRKIYLTNSFIYILDKKFENLKLYLFNNNGKFITKTIKGKGPGEVLYPIDFLVSENSKEVYVWDLMFNKMTVLDLHLNPITHFFIDTEVPIYNLSRLNDDRWFIHKPTAPRTEDEEFYLYGIADSASFGNVNKFIFRMPSSYYSLEMANPIAKWYDNDIKFIRPVGYTIYGLKDTGVYDAYHFEFENLNFSSKEFNNNTMHDILIAGREGVKVVGLSNIIETKDQLGFTLRWKKFDDFIIYDKLKKQYVTSIALFQSDVLPKGKLIALDGNNNFVIASSPLDYNSWSGRNMRFDVNSTDNDVLTMFTIE